MTFNKSSFLSLSLLVGLGFSACIPKQPTPSRAPIKVADKPAPTPTPEPESKKKTEAVDFVKVGLRTDIRSIDVSVLEDVALLDNTGTSVGTLGKGQISVTPRGNKINVGGTTLSSPVKLQPVGDRPAFQLGEKGYRGIFMFITTDSGEMNLVNVLTIDDYLKGVLPREVVSSWHMESLRVQAVASRTYLASHLGRHSKQGFDLCSDVHCQVYGGTAKEHASTNKAVDDTTGEIMVYNGDPIGAFFHSNCGGMTEDIYAVWRSQSRPYLKPVKCPYGTKDPKYSWTRDIPNDEIIKKLKEKTKVEGSRLSSLEIAKKSGSGRAEIIKVVTNKGTYQLAGNEFRLALHPERIRSTLWTSLSKTSGGYHIEGRGWGHGVGMCQWGAKGQAEAGRDYRQILLFYYPNVKFTHWHR